MADASFLSPRLEQHSYGQRPLHAIAGYNDAPLPLDIHVHREVEVGIVLAGEEQIHFSETVQICRPGDVWLCGSWEPHGWLIDRPRVRNAVLIFQPEFLGEEMLGELPWLTLFAVPPDQRPRVGSPEIRRRVLAIGQMLRQEIEGHPRDWEALIRIELLHLLLLLKREWGGRRPAPSGHVRLSTLARVMPALTLSHSQPWRRVSVAEAAASCGLSASHFQSLFHRAVGVSFGQFSLRARLSFAANRVLNTDRSISAIAAEAGFADGSHLHRRFRQQYQRTPRQYRTGLPGAAGNRGSKVENRK